MRLAKVACVPLGLVLLEDLALRVVADVHDVDETAQIELLGSELSHDCGFVGMRACCVMTCGPKMRSQSCRQDMG